MLWGQGGLRRFNGKPIPSGMNDRGSLHAAQVGLGLYASEQMLVGLSFMCSWGAMNCTEVWIDGV